MPRTPSEDEHPLTEALVWRVLRDEPACGAINMARDEALARACAGDAAVLRLYGWVRPTVSFGRNEPARALYRTPRAGPGGPDPADPADLPLDFVRRPTGGRAVLHDAEVTYTVVAGFEALGGARKAYRRINAALAEGLRSLGAEVEIAPSVADSATPEGGSRSGGTPVDAGPCFRLPAPGEVTASGRKLVGSAQARIGRTLLQHGSIILRGDQSRLAALQPAAADVGGRAADVDAPAALEDLVGPVDPWAVRDALARSIVDAFGGVGVEGAFTDEELGLAERLLEDRYGRLEWTWRR